MGLMAEIVVASGRATCKLCSKLIKKGSKQVRISGYRTQASLHARCPQKYHCDATVKLIKTSKGEYV